MNAAGLLPASLLCAACLAMILSRRGVRLSFTSPLAILPAVYLLSLGLPSLSYGLGIRTQDAFFRPHYTAAVSYYSFAMLSIFYLGYIMAEFGRRAKLRDSGLEYSRSERRASLGGSRLRIRWGIDGIYGEISANFLLGIGTLALAIHACVIGRGRFLEGLVPRGDGQWNPLGSQYYLDSFALFLLLMSTITAGLIQAWRPQRRLWVVPLPFALFLAARGSRGTFLPFLLFVLACELVKRTPSLKRVASIGLLCLCSVIIIAEVRSPYLGLADFLQSVRQAPRAVTEVRPLAGFSSLGVSTAAFWISDNMQVEGRLRHVAAELAPLPSFIVHQDRRFTDILPYLGIRDSGSAFPFPVIGELYFFFGWPGILLAFPAGFGAARLYFCCRSVRPEEYPIAILWPLVYLACIFAVVMSVHSGLRTVTRLPLWALVWYVMFTQAIRFLASPLHLEKLRVTQRSSPQPRAAANLQPNRSLSVDG